MLSEECEDGFKDFSVIDKAHSGSGASGLGEIHWHLQMLLIVEKLHLRIRGTDKILYKEWHDENGLKFFKL